jgi:hypothetical protein
MLNQQRLKEEHAATFSGESCAAGFEIGNSRFGLTVIMALACLIGSWGLVCFINGILECQSIQVLSQGILTAVTGV